MLISSRPLAQLLRALGHIFGNSAKDIGGRVASGEMADHPSGEEDAGGFPHPSSTQWLVEDRGYHFESAISVSHREGEARSVARAKLYGSYEDRLWHAPHHAPGTDEAGGTNPLATGTGPDGPLVRHPAGRADDGTSRAHVAVTLYPPISPGFGETPYNYLMTRRIERAMALLRRGDLTVTEVCLAVGASSLGSFSARFTELVGQSPSVYRAAQRVTPAAAVPACVAKSWLRPKLCR